MYRFITIINRFRLAGRGDKLLRLSLANSKNASQQQTPLTKQNSKASGKKRSTPLPEQRSPDEENSPPKIKKSNQRLLRNARSAGGEGNGDAFDENDEEPHSQSMLADQAPSPMAEHDDTDLNSSRDLFDDECQKGDQSNDQSTEDTAILEANEGGLEEHSSSRNLESLQGPSTNNKVPKEVENESGDGAGLGEPEDPNVQGKK